MISKTTALYVGTVFIAWLCLLLFGLEAANLYLVNWKVDIYFDLFFARIYGPFDYLSHGSSLAFITLAGLVLIYETRLKARPLISAFLVLYDMTSLHEIAYTLSYTHTPYYSPISIQSVIQLCVNTSLLIVSFKVLNTRQLKSLGYISAFLIPFYTLLAIFAIPQTMGDNFTLAKAAFDLFPNAVEVIGWAIPSLLLIVFARDKK